MKILKQKLGPIWSAALLVCLTIVLVTAATATAATIINGKNIKKGTITGNKLKKNTLTGTQINEDKLGAVPSAKRSDSALHADVASDSGKLAGLDPSAFTRGGGHDYSASVNGASNTGNITVLDIPGLLVLRFDCAAGGIATTPEVLNQSGGGMYILGQGFGSGSGASATPVIEPNSTTWNDNIYVAMQQRSLGNGTFQVWNSSGATKVATVTYSSIFCSYTAQASVS
jgi:hypothetical protein